MSPFLLESFIILLNEYNGGFSMLEKYHKALDALAGFIYLIDYILILIIGYFGAVSIINKDYIKLLECFFFISVCLFLGILLNIIVNKVIL